MQSLKAPLPKVDNSAISIFKVESSSKKGRATMATRKATSTQTTEQTEQTQAPVEQPSGETTAVAQAQGFLATSKAGREMLRQQGFRLCPTHRKFWDRLPADAKVPQGDFEDGAIRPLSEFWKSTSQCRHCDKLIQSDYRNRVRAGTVGKAATREAREQRLATLVARRDALTAQIDALQAALATDEQV